MEFSCFKGLCPRLQSNSIQSDVLSYFTLSMDSLGTACTLKSSIILIIQECNNVESLEKHNCTDTSYMSVAIELCKEKNGKTHVDIILLTGAEASSIRSRLIPVTLGRLCTVAARRNNRMRV